MTYNERLDQSRERLIRARESARTIVFDDASWLVFELEDVYDRRNPSLLFESEGAMRLVRVFPANWRELSDAELYALSWGR